MTNAFFSVWQGEIWETQYCGRNGIKKRIFCSCVGKGNEIGQKFMLGEILSLYIRTLFKNQKYSEALHCFANTGILSAQTTCLHGCLLMTVNTLI